MKRSILILALILNAVAVFAQQPEVVWGPEHKPGEGGFSGIIGYDDDGYYVPRVYTKGLKQILFLDQFNYNHELKFSRELKFKSEYRGKENHKTKIEGLYYFSKKILLLTSYYDKESQKNLAFAQYLEKSGEPLTEAMPVDEIRVEKESQIGAFGFVVSPQSNWLFIYHREPGAEDENAQLSYQMFDSDLQLLWSKNIKVSGKNMNVQITSCILDSLGNVFTVAAIKDEQIGKKNNYEGDLTSYYSYHVLEYDWLRDREYDYKIDLSGKFLTKIGLIEDTKHHTMICAGFYSNRKDFGDHGTFSMYIDKSKHEVKNFGMMEFDKGTLRLYLVNEAQLKNGKGVYNFRIMNFLLQESGGIILIAEQYAAVTSCSSGSGCISTYSADEIFCASISPDASIAWMTQVPKRQCTENDGGFYLSYAFAVTNNTMHFLFNDNIKNAKKRLAAQSDRNFASMKKPKKSQPIECTVDMNTGKLGSKLLPNVKPEAAIFKPNLYRMVSDGKLIIYSVGKKGKYRFGTLTLN